MPDSPPTTESYQDAKRIAEELLAAHERADLEWSGLRDAALDLAEAFLSLYAELEEKKHA